MIDRLPEFMNKKFSLTGTYVARYDHPFKKFNLDENDELKAHIDLEAEKVMTYISCSEDHKFMMNKNLPKAKSCTYSLFDDKDETEAVNYDTEVDEETGDEIVKYLYIEDVIRPGDNKVHFFKYPRLGSYIAFPLIY